MQGGRRPTPCRHHDLHRRHRARGPRSTRPRLRRPGQDPVRRSAHAAPCQGVALPSRDRLRHGVRRVVEPVDQRAARGRRVERAPLECRDSEPDAEVPSDVRLVLEQQRVRDLRPRPRPRSTRRRTQRGRRTTSLQPRDHLDLRVCRCVRFPTSRRCSTPSRSSASSTTGTATSWSQRPAPARPSSLRSTTDDWLSRATNARRFSSSLTARRSWSSRSGPIGRCSPTPTSASSTSATRGPSVGSTSSPACSPFMPTACRTSPPTRSTSSSSMSSTTQRQRPTAASSTTSLPGSCWVSRRRRNASDGVDVRSFFDGRTAAELRLWDALGADLLCPFHYFAVADGTDLRAIKWTQGPVRRGAALERLHRQRRSGRDRPAASCATRSRTSGTCVASASASALPTPSTWPACSWKPASRRGP